jgi:hypothetical protein
MARLDWHFVWDGEQKGPVSTEDFERFVESGLVTDTTLVGREGSGGTPCCDVSAYAGP